LKEQAFGGVSEIAKSGDHKVAHGFGGLTREEVRVDMIANDSSTMKGNNTFAKKDNSALAEVPGAMLGNDRVRGYELRHKRNTLAVISNEGRWQIKRQGSTG
jgi:hypothetical protein